MEFELPPAEAVLEILAEWARMDRTLATQIEAAQWKAIAITTNQPDPADPGKEPVD